MIYTVNLISKNKDGVVTTTNITDYVEHGFSVLEKLDETFDTGTITLVNTDRDKPYNMWDIIQILIDDVEIASLRIASDSISLASKRPLKYDHVLTLVEHTKLLELFTISGKTFTQPTDGSTAYTIANVIETLFRITPLEIEGIFKNNFIKQLGFNIGDSFEARKNIGNDGSVTINVNLNDIYDVTFNYNLLGDLSIGVNVLDNYVAFKNPSNAVTSLLDVNVIENYLVDKNNGVAFSNTVDVNINDNYVAEKLTQIERDSSIVLTLSLFDNYETDRPVEWASTTNTNTTPDQTCTDESDIENIKSVTSTNCSFVQSFGYISSTDDTTSQPLCSDGATYTLCLYDDVSNEWVCTTYVGEETTTTEYFICQLQ